jgi:hypothetical protein
MPNSTITQSVLIPCQCCGRAYPSLTPIWYVCDKCYFRVCPACITKHKGKYGSGMKCSQCPWGYMKGQKKIE